MLFGSRKKNEAATPRVKNETAGGETAGGASVNVLGGGCARCNALADAAVQALCELGMNPAIDHVTDYSKIAAYGVMSAPALVVNGKVVSSGRVLKKEEVIKILKECAADMK